MKNLALLLWLAAAALPSLRAQTPVLNFLIQNARSDSGWYKFDLMVYCNTAGTFHSRGQLYLSYNTAAFGTSVAANSRLVITPGPLLREKPPGQTSFKYQVPPAVDNTGSIFSMGWFGTFLVIGPNPDWVTEVPTTPALLMRVRIQYVDPLQSPNVAFVPALMRGQQFRLTGANMEAPYDEGYPSAPTFVDSELSSLNLNLYPNPVSRVIYLKNLSGQGLLNDYSVWSADGRRVLAGRFSRSVSSVDDEIALPELPAGLYILRCTGINGQNASFSFIIGNR